MKIKNNLLIEGGLTATPLTPTQKTSRVTATQDGDTIFDDATKTWYIREDGRYVPLVPSKAFMVLQSDNQSDNTVNLNTATEVDISFSGATFDESFGYFTQVGNTIVTNFQGWVRAAYMVPHTSTGQRPTIETGIRRTGLFSRQAQAFSYIRNGSGHIKDTNVGCEILPCFPNQVFKVVAIRAGSNQTAVNLFSFANFSLERIR